MFAYPAPPADADSGPRLVLKTLAVQPQLRRLGLGKLLVERANWAARQTGYAQVIHALMQDDNVSARLRAEHTRVFRRYTLFVRDLEAAS